MSLLLTYFIPCSSVSIVNFKHVIGYKLGKLLLNASQYLVLNRSSHRRCSIKVLQNSQEKPRVRASAYKNTLLHRPPPGDCLNKSNFYSSQTIIFQRTSSVFNNSDEGRLIVGVSPSKKNLCYLLQWKPFKIDSKCFLLHFKSSFRSQDIWIFVLAFCSCGKNGSTRNVRLITSHPCTHSLVNKQLQHTYYPVSPEVNITRQWN